MIAKRHHGWDEMRWRFRDVPALSVLGAIATATILMAADATVELRVVERRPQLYSAGASGVRGLLTAVAGSIIIAARSQPHTRRASFRPGAPVNHEHLK